MIKRPVFVACLLVLAGCAVPQVSAPVVVQSVVLYRQTVTALMSDGALCVGQRPQGAKIWSGVMTGCAYPLAYQVTRLPRAPREVLIRGAGQGVIVDGQGYGPA